MALGIGVELGPTALRAVAVERSGQRLTLLAAHDGPCDTSNAEALTRALTEARRSLRITTPVVLGVPSTSAILATVHPLIVNARRAACAVQFELQQQLPFELGDAVWHYHWLSNGQGRSGQMPKAHSPQPRTSSPQRFPHGVVAAAMKRSLLDERLACCRRAGLVVQSVAVNPLAMLSVCDVKRTLLHRAAGTPSPAAPVLTLLVLTDEQTAEWVVSTPALLLAIPVASPSADLLWQEIAASWGALRAQGFEVPTPVRVIGPSAAIARARETLSGVPLEPFDVTRVTAAGSVRVEHPERVVTALGLALQGIGMGAIPLNLLAASQNEVRSFKIRRIAAVASGLFAVATFGFGVSGMIEVRSRQVRILRSLEQRERLYQKLRPDLRALLQHQQRTERRSLQLERLLGESPTVSRVLAQVAAALPDDAWLTVFESSKGDMLHGVLEGRTESFQNVTKFLERLKDVAGMSTAKPLSTNVTTDETSGKEAVAFSVEIQQPLHQ